MVIRGSQEREHSRDAGRPGGGGPEAGPAASRRGPRPAAVLAAVGAMGAVGGLVLGFVAALWGSTPAGNTALVVPFAGGPALLAAGWAVLILALRHRVESRERLVAGGLAAGGAALVLALGAVFTPAITLVSGVSGPETQRNVSLLALAVPLLLAMLVGVALAAWLGKPVGRRGWGAGAAAALLGIAAIVLVPGLGFTLAPLLIPLALLAPLLAARGSHPAAGAGPRWGWLAAGALALLPVVVAGLVAGMALGRA